MQTIDTSKRISFFPHKNQEILFIDYKGCKTKEQMITVLESAADVMRSSAGELLVLSDFSGTHGSVEFMDKAKKLGREVFKEKNKRSAVIGVTGLKKILLNGYNTFAADAIKPFDTKELALEYLVNEN